jgi:hypothetical protein
MASLLLAADVRGSLSDSFASKPAILLSGTGAGLFWSAEANAQTHTETRIAPAMLIR